MSSGRRKKTLRPEPRRDAGERTLPEQVPRRLEHLYEISKLCASFENIQHTFDPVLAIISRTLPLRSAILVEAQDSGSQMIVWASEGQDAEQLRAVKENVAAAFAYLVGAASSKALELREQAGATTLPRQAILEGAPAKRAIVIPLVVARRSPFGVLQLEGARSLDKADLMFVNAIANQLAIALDRDRAWRLDIARREHAEEERIRAVERGAAAERDRRIAEHLREKYETLAGENARLYEQAQEAVRAREQILAIVSHDLKSPLQTILMSSSVLAKTGAPEEIQGDPQQVVGRIQRAAQRMLRLIEDLLDFASIQAGRLAIKRDLQDSGSMLQETIASFESFAQDKQLGLTAEVEPDLPKVYCDRDRIMQVLANLVGNATKVTAEGGRITLRVEDRRHELLFSVSDDGPGIGEEDAKHLFERYWRSGEMQYKGTGLGLAIAQGIVSAHGGRIWAKSELGRGATFLFTLPAPDDRRRTTRRVGEPPAQSAPSTPPTSPKGDE